MAENGIQYSTGNTLNFTTNGTTWATLTSGGTFQVSSISASTTTAPFTTGSVIFQGSGGTLSQNNSNLFWDNTNSRLGIGVSAPSALVSLQVTGDTPGDMFTLRNRGGAYDKLAMGWSANGYNSYIGFGGGSGFYLNFINNNGGATVMQLRDQGPVLVGPQADSRIAVQKSTAPTSITIANSYFLVDMGYGSGGLNRVGTIAFGGPYVNPSAYISYLNQTDGDFGKGAMLFGMRANSSADNPATEYMRLTNTGNLLIGTTTDAGFKLDVNGISIIRGELYVSTSISCPVYISQGATTGTKFDIQPINQFLGTSGSVVLLNVAHTSGGGFMPTGGTATHTMLQLASTINQTGAANGITRGLYVNPTISAATDFRAIETKGRIFSIYDTAYDNNALNTNFVLQHSNGSSAGLGVTSDGNMRIKTTSLALISGSIETWFNRFGHSSIQSFSGDFGIYGSSDIQKFRIFNSTGNVLIQNGGTFTDAGYRLDVNGTTRFNGASLTLGTTGLLSTWQGTNHSLYFYHENTTTFRILSSLGPALDIKSDSFRFVNSPVVVGVNTTPLARLHVQGLGSTSGTTSLRVENSGATSSLVVLDNGNVGIGTNSPVGELEVTNSELVGVGQTSSSVIINASQTAGGGTGGAVKYGLQIIGSGAFNRNVGTAVYGLNIPAYSGSVYAGFNMGAYIQDRVALGTYNPIDQNVSSLLTVGNSVNYSTYNNNPNSIYLRLNSNTNDITAGIYASQAATTVQSGIFFTRGVGNGVGVIDFVTANANVTGTLNARMFGNGNLVLQNGGTFTDAGFRLDVNGVARVSGDITLGGWIRTPQTGNLIVNVGNFALQLTSNNPQNSSGSLITTGDITRTDSGTKNIIDVNNSVSSTSASFNTLNGYAFTSVINQTLGTIRGLYIAPTLSSSTDFRAIETTSGNVLFGTGFTWDNTNTRLGIGVTTPQARVETNGTFRTTGSNTPTTGVGLELNFNSGVGNIYSFNRTTTQYSPLNLNDAARIFSTLNIGVGTITDSGYKLDVNGTVRLSTIYFNGAATTGNISATSSSLEFNAPTSFGVFNFNCSGGGRRVSINGTASDTVGNDLLSIPFVVQNTTGTNRNFSMLNVNPTINNTSGYTGTVRGLYYNPTITSLVGTTHRAIETTAGDVLFGTSGTGLFWNNANNRLGIGTASPNNTLDIVGGAIISSSLSINGNFVMSEASNVHTFTAPATNRTIRFITNSQSYSLFPTGNFAIGTTTDSGVKLDVNGTARVSGNLTAGVLTAGSDNFLSLLGSDNGYFRVRTLQGAVFVGLGDTSNGTNGNFFGITRTYLNEYGNINAFMSTDNRDFGFRFGAYGTSVEALRITTTKIILSPNTGSNVLIGKTTDSGQKLQVSGNTLLQGSLTANTISATTYYNLPQSVSGTGTQDYVTKWDSSGLGVVNSTITDDGTYVSIPSLIVTGSGNWIPGPVDTIINNDEYMYPLNVDASGNINQSLNEGFMTSSSLFLNNTFLTLLNDSDHRAIKIFYSITSSDDQYYRSGDIIANWDSTYTTFNQTEYGPVGNLPTSQTINVPTIQHGGIHSEIGIYISGTYSAKVTLKIKYTLL